MTFCDFRFILALSIIIRVIAIEWGPWGACSVTCDRGVRHRRKQCTSGDLPPVDDQDTEDQSCATGNICAKGIVAKKFFLVHENQFLVLRLCCANKSFLSLGLNLL